MLTHTILIVDDEALIRWSIAQHLMQHGYRVLEAASGAEARLALTACGGPDLVLLDLKLPDSDGLVLLEHVRRVRRDCRVIVLSAHATRETACEALAGGACSVVHKPFDLQALAALVERTLAGAGPASATRDTA